MNPWEFDRLGYQHIGETFTNLVKTIETAKVISIEAGFGRGKTFFRKAWSEQLRESGEVVIEVDVQQSDHSGDPVVTLLGALVEVLPREDAAKGKKAIDSAKKLGAIGARAVAKIALRSGADELIDAVTDTALDKLDDFDALDEVIGELGEGMSKAAGQFIAAQMAAENVRKKEMPQQLETLHSALVQGVESERVIIIIDELDRCHPDYAIAFLEAMKLVFNQTGFVFCLMVNANYLEKLAQHRFGTATNDEKYLDKFVDIRLGLNPNDESMKGAIYDLTMDLPLKIPYGDGYEFRLEHAAELAGQLAVQSKLSMRKIKRILLRVELAMRCYADRPLDASLLVLLAFQTELNAPLVSDLLPRSYLTPAEGKASLESIDKVRMGSSESTRRAEHRLKEWIHEKGIELTQLPRDRYSFPDNANYKDWAMVFQFLAPHYVPNHMDALNAVASVLVPSDD